MTNDLIAFLRARLDEDADTARRAHKHGVGRWHSGIHPDYVEEWDISGDGVVDDNHQTVVYDEGYPSKEQSEHIARNDPERVLAEVEAKRAIVRLHWQRVSRWCEVCDVPGDHQGRPEGCTTVRLLAIPYADHPDYRDEWRP